MDTNGMKRVVVTGIGPVTSVGIGKDQFREGIHAGRSPAVPLPATYRAHYNPKTAFFVPLPEVKLAEYGLPVRYDRIMQPEARIALAGAKLALEDAGYHMTSNNETVRIEGLFDTCTVIGIGIAGLENAFHSYVAHCQTGTPEVDGSRIPHYQRMIIPMIMSNAPAAWVTILFGLTEGSFTVNASCASGTAAIGQAFLRIAHGMNRCALCGGVEALVERNGSIMRGFDMLGVLTRSPDGVPRPFSDERSGFLFSEGGGCMLVLEELEHARERHARIYAEITCFADTSDAYNIVQCDPGGTQIVRLLQVLSKGRTIDYLNTHGTATELNDATERDAILTVFGKKSTQPLLNATKGLIGHTIGASGAIEAAVSILAVYHNEVHGTLVDNPFPELNMHRDNISATVNRAASVSFGFGGHNCGLVFEKYRDG